MCACCLEHSACLIVPGSQDSRSTMWRTVSRHSLTSVAIYLCAKPINFNYRCSQNLVIIFFKLIGMLLIFVWGNKYQFPFYHWNSLSLCPLVISNIDFQQHCKHCTKEKIIKCHLITKGNHCTILLTAKNRGIAIPVDLDSQVNTMFSKSQIVMKTTRKWLNAGSSRRDSAMTVSRDYRSIIEGLQVTGSS